MEFRSKIAYMPAAKMTHIGALSRKPIEVIQLDITEGDWIVAA